MSASSPRPITPRPRDTSATRQAILDAAQVAFATRGYAGARIDEIARASGYNKNLIFRHYGDKAGLYDAVVQRFRERSDTAYSAAVAPLVGPGRPFDRALIERVVRASVQWSFTHLQQEPEYLRLFVWEMAEGWRAFHGGGTSIEPSMRWGLELLRRAQAAGLIRPDITPDTILEQMVMLPLTTLAAIPRFAALRRELHPDGTAISDHLRDQVTSILLHAMLPDH